MYVCVSIEDRPLIIPGCKSFGNEDGAGEGANASVEFAPSDIGDSDGGEADICSLSHNSEQLVFQKPTFEFSRSYNTRVFRTTIPIETKRLNTDHKETCNSRS